MQEENTGFLTTAFLSVLTALAAASCGSDVQLGFPGVFAPPPVLTVPIVPSGNGLSTFGTAPLDITATTEVDWENRDSIAHSVVSDTNLFNSGPIQPGNDFSYTFDVAGTFTYHCGIHPKETGAINVNASPTTTPTIGTTATPAPSATPQTVLTPSPTLGGTAAPPPTYTPVPIPTVSLTPF